MVDLSQSPAEAHRRGAKPDLFMKWLRELTNVSPYKVNELPRIGAVYLFCESNESVYVGECQDLRARINVHLTSKQTTGKHTLAETMAKGDDSKHKVTLQEMEPFQDRIKGMSFGFVKVPNLLNRVDFEAFANSLLVPKYSSVKSTGPNNKINLKSQRREAWETSTQWFVPVDYAQSNG